MLRLLDRYLLSEFLRPLLFGVSLFSLLIIVTVVLSEALRFVQRYNLPPSVIGKMMAFSAPEFIILSIPMGALLGTLLAIGRLNSDHEIVAMRACGISLWRILYPLLITGAILAAITILGTELVVPYTRGQLLALKNSVRSGELSLTQQRVLIPIREGGALRWILSAADMEGPLLSEIRLLYFDPNTSQRDMVMRAESATWSGSHWNFRGLRQVLVQSGPGGDELVRLDTRQIDIPDFNIQPEDLEARQRAAEDVSARQLGAYIRQLEEGLSRAGDTDAEIDALRELSQEIREEAADISAPERVLVPVYEEAQMRWLLVARGIVNNEVLNAQLFHFAEDGEDFIVSAERMVWTGRGWQFHGMRQVLVDPAPGETGIIQETEVGTLPQFDLGPDSLELRMQLAEDLSALQLRQRIRELDLSGDGSERELWDLRTKYFFKFTLPLTPLFFIFVAFPLAILPQRASNTRGMGVALLLVLAYYAMYSVFQKLGATGALPPIVAAWLPNFVLGAAGFILMERRQRS